MGECGCSDFQPDFRFRGPGDKWYIVQSYPSCRNCDTPVGVILYLSTPKDAEMWGLEHVKEVSIPSEGQLIPVLHPRILKDRLAAWLLKSAQYTAGELMEECFTEAVHESFDDIQQ